MRLTAQKVYTMLENESLWQAATQCHEALAAAKIPHVFMGGVAVCLHGYQRNTVDVDLLIRHVHELAVREKLQIAGLPVRCLLAGDEAGVNSRVKLPDPADEKSITEIEGLPVLTLVKLIESKIACGKGNPRRMHKDFADVVELIVFNRLNGSYARLLHKSLRTTYKQLAKNSLGAS